MIGIVVGVVSCRVEAGARDTRNAELRDETAGIVPFLRYGRRLTSEYTRGT
ncbi:hypothetical protein [Burkholderia ambifaria]|uniref:hypothetical protein n=1 Tax=Burkholderia ambifaria TaxID=152480 RepID=UPI00158E0BE4|nr:hypothetical protein [Burkholderia ambifaria]